MNGVTGRVGSGQHLLRSIHAIRQEGGLRLSDDVVLMPEPVLVGRSPHKLESLSSSVGGADWTTDLERVLCDPSIEIYFDAQSTGRRFDSVSLAIRAGKHVYAEKPSSTTTAEALELFRNAEEAGVRHGVVQDKLWQPGLVKLRTLIDTGFLGRILSVRGEFGYWVFEGDVVRAQRPSWYSRKEEHGGIVVDMFSHWRYLLDNLVAPVREVSCRTATHIPERWDEQGQRYAATADDSAYATFGLEGGIVAHFNSSFCTRARRDDILSIQVDGTKGSAVAGIRSCVCQHYGQTPKPTWNPDLPSTIDYREGWMEVPDTSAYPNAFRAQWELFLRHVVLDEPFPWGLLEGAKGIQLAEISLESSIRRCWLDVPDLI